MTDDDIQYHIDCLSEIDSLESESFASSDDSRDSDYD